MTNEIIIKNQGQVSRVMAFQLLNYSRNTLIISLIWILVDSIIIVNSPVVIALFSLPDSMVRECLEIMAEASARG